MSEIVILYLSVGMITLAGLNIIQILINRQERKKLKPWNILALNLIALPLWVLWAPALLIQNIRAYRDSAVCLWCGKSVVIPYDKTSALAHIRECPEHPLRKELALAREKISELEDQVSEASQFGRWER